MNQKQSRKHAFLADYPRHLPPVDLNKMHVARGRIVNTTATKTHTDKTLNLILGPHSRTNVSVVSRQTRPALAPWLMDNRSLHVSEVTNHDDTETEAEMELSGETDVSSSIHDIPQRGLGFRRSAVSWKLPNIYRYLQYCCVF